jgi:hypothetical protein
MRRRILSREVDPELFEGSALMTTEDLDAPSLERGGGHRTTSRPRVEGAAKVVVRGHLVALQKGDPGDRFIIGGVGGGDWLYSSGKACEKLSPLEHGLMTTARWGSELQGLK